jgi:hypothetical protein
METISVPFAKIGANHIVLYSHILDRPTRSDKQVQNEANLRDIQYNGFMSPKTKGKVRKFLEAWITSVENRRIDLRKGKYFRNGKLAFITLTLSAEQTHDDNFIKRHMFNRFIQEAKRKWGMNTYFWRAEAQTNGNIHFHILIDCFVEWKDVRSVWNNIQSDHGYIDRFEAVHGHRNPNSTDVHGLEELRNTVAYVVKYCCKTDGTRPIKGRIWGASDNLRTLTTFEREIDSTVMKYVEEVKQQKEVRVREGDGYTVIFCDNVELMRRISPHLFADWKAHYSEIYSRLYEGKSETFIEEILTAVVEERVEQQVSYLQANIDFSVCMN